MSGCDLYTGDMEAWIFLDRDSNQFSRIEATVQPIQGGADSILDCRVRSKTSPNLQGNKIQSHEVPT